MIEAFMIATFLTVSSFATEEPSAEESQQEIQALPGEQRTQQIVVITEPEFVPISQYFVTELNDLPPSSSGTEPANTP